MLPSTTTFGELALYALPKAGYALKPIARSAVDAYKRGPTPARRVAAPFFLSTSLLGVPTEAQSFFVLERRDAREEERDCGGEPGRPECAAM